GGHMPGETVVDLFYDGREFSEFVMPRVHVSSAGGRIHGTGCTYASAVAAGLAVGHSLHEAARRAQAYVGGAILHARALGQGAALLDHFWQATLHDDYPKIARKHEVL